MKNIQKPMPHRLVDGKGHYFFGYYDVPAFSQNNRYHLCHRVNFWNRLPKENDIAEIGMIDMEQSSFIPLAETTAWNFQQGSMLQWHPNALNSNIIFNRREKGMDNGVILDIHTKEEKKLEAPIANVDPKGKFALSINFNRLYDFRPGYGYAGLVDKYKDIYHPNKDGVLLVDLETGKSNLIISLEQIWNEIKHFLNGQEYKILINHITFNTEGTRFLFLVRTFPKDGGKWGTMLMSANTNGGDLYCMTGYSIVSHYHWKNENEIVIYADGPKGLQLYVYKDKTQQKEIIDTTFFLGDGHCSFSPDRNWLLYDSYPDANHKQYLYLYNMEQNKGITLGSYYSEPSSSIDIRCDLHPRWNHSGKAISFDSTHEGKRNVYYMDIEKTQNQFL